MLSAIIGLSLAHSAFVENPMDRIRIGDSKARVIEVLGKPFAVYTAYDLPAKPTLWLYGTPAQPFYPDLGSIQFDRDNRVERIVGQGIRQRLTDAQRQLIARIHRIERLDTWPINLGPWVELARDVRQLPPAERLTVLREYSRTMPDLFLCDIVLPDGSRLDAHFGFRLDLLLILLRGPGYEPEFERHVRLGPRPTPYVIFFDDLPFVVPRSRVASQMVPPKGSYDDLINQVKVLSFRGEQSLAYREPSVEWLQKLFVRYYPQLDKDERQRAGKYLLDLWRRQYREWRK